MIPTQIDLLKEENRELKIVIEDYEKMIIDLRQTISNMTEDIRKDNQRLKEAIKLLTNK